jgi:hypothetical protein
MGKAEMKHSKKTLDALRWFAVHEPVGWFDAAAPTMQMRRLLEKRGLIERLPYNKRLASVIKFQLSAAGRLALEPGQ